MAVGDGQLWLFGRLADNRERAALTFADSLETLEIGGTDGQHVTLLGLVAPDLVRGHARLVVGHVAQFEAATAATVVDQLREGIGNATGTDVMDEGDGVLVAQLPAAVDDLLAAAFHFRVLALYRGEIQIGRAGTGRDRGGGAAAQADQHGRAAEHDQLGANGDLGLLHVIFTDVAHAASEHDRLVITTHLVAARRVDRLLEGTEVTGQRRAAELVVERGAAQRAFNHDVQRRDDAFRLAVGLFPRLLEAGDVQVGDGETGQTGLWLGAAAGGALVANLAAGAGGSTGEWRDGRRVVVGFHLHQDVHRLLHRAVLAGFRIGEETPCGVADDDRRVVLVSGQHVLAVHLVGVLDHAEQRLVLALAVDVPAGVEDLVAAVLGVGLREHHQFDVVRVALEALEGTDQIIDLVFGQGQAQVGVGLFQRGATATEDVHGSQRLGLGMAEQVGGCFETIEHHLCHAIVKRCGNQLCIAIGKLALHVIGDAPLQPLDLLQPAVVGDIAGLARPRRNGAEARHHEEQPPGRFLHRHTGAVLQQAGQYVLLIRAERAGNLGEMGELGIQPADGGDLIGQLCQELAMTEGGKSGSAAQDQHRRNSLGGGSSRGAYSSP